MVARSKGEVRGGASPSGCRLEMFSPVVPKRETQNGLAHLGWHRSVLKLVLLETFGKAFQKR